jgi:hypothetical protein
VRWRSVDFTRYPIHLLDAFQAAGVVTLAPERGGWRVYGWAWDLYEASIAPGEAWWVDLRGRLCVAVPVVGKPGGVDPDAFSAALKLGGWEAARDLCAGVG